MIYWKPELIAFWEKYKDIEKDEEWRLLAKEIGKFDDPAIVPLAVRCLKAIEARYYQRYGKKHKQA